MIKPQKTMHSETGKFSITKARKSSTTKENLVQPRIYKRNLVQVSVKKCEPMCRLHYK